MKKRYSSCFTDVINAKALKLFWLLLMLVFTLPGSAQEVSSPASLPEVKYHLTARPWQPLNIPRERYLDQVEGIVRQIVKYQNWRGAIIDPYSGNEEQYATPYFANAVGTLLAAGRAPDLLAAGVAAMNKATSDIAAGGGSIPDNHGEFFLAPLASAIPMFTPYVSKAELRVWEKRMATPIKHILRGSTHNWRTYAMKGEWYRAKNGYINKTDALDWLEDSWQNTQKKRFTANRWNFYLDRTTDPDTWAYEAVARGNLANMLAEGYEGASRPEMLDILQKGTQASLLLQDPSGQAAAGGRSGNHTWNDIVAANTYEVLAEMSRQQGDARLAGQYRRAAALGFRSIQRWRRPNGTYSVTKNHFNPKERTRYADYSHFTNYNGYLMFHMAENYLRHTSNIPEQPAPNEIGGYTLVTDPALAAAVANAGGMHLQVNLRGSTDLKHEIYWTALGVVRFGRTGWDSRLGPSDGVRESESKYGVSFAPTFLENGQWLRLASQPDRYEASFSTQFTHPLLVRCRVEYTPKAGQTGPTFTNDFVITPDGIRSTLSSTAPDFGVTWPVLTSDGATNLNINTTANSVSLAYPGATDEQHYIALHAAPTISTTDLTRRSSYGDLLPVRMVSDTAVNVTFIYPRSAGDPEAELVSKSYQQSGNNFSTVLGRVNQNTYVGRTAAGGEGKELDLNQDSVADVTFNIACGFILQLNQGKVVKIETDRPVVATVQGQTVSLQAYTPLEITESEKPTEISVSANTAQGPNVAANTLDGDLNTRWSALGKGHWLQLDLKDIVSVEAVRIAWYQGQARTADFAIQTSLDGNNWTQVYRGESSGKTAGLEEYPVSASGRYVRIVCYGNSLHSWNAITEVEIYPGQKLPPTVSEPAEIKPGVSSGKVVIWPNPSQGIFSIKTDLTVWAGAEVIIYDAWGNVAFQKIIDQEITEINLAHKPAGIYLVKLAINGRVSEGNRIVIQQ